MKSKIAAIFIWSLFWIVPIALTADVALSGPAEVREIQQSLTDMGYAPGPIDGAWGGKTEAASRKFLQDKKYDANTVFGEGSRDDAALLAHIKAAQAAEKIAAEQAAMRAAKGLALVIGNSAYKNTKKLMNPAKDAALMVATLEAAGFIATHLKDADQKAMKQAMHSFGRKLRDSGKPGFFYYAGHGVQVDGANYLVPADATIRDEAEVAFEGVPIDAFMRTLKRDANNINIVVLDIYHRNPYAATFRSAQRGFARTEAPHGTYLAVAASPDQDGSAGGQEYSPYTWALANAIIMPGLVIEEVFKKARRDVLAASDNQQQPFEASSITGEFLFFDKGEQVDSSKVLARARAKGPIEMIGKSILVQGCYTATNRLGVPLTNGVAQLVYFSKNGDFFLFDNPDEGMRIKSGEDWGKRVIHEGVKSTNRTKIELKGNAVNIITKTIIHKIKYKHDTKFHITISDNKSCNCNYFSRSSKSKGLVFSNLICNFCNMYDEQAGRLAKRVWIDGSVRAGILPDCP